MAHVRNNQGIFLHSPEVVFTKNAPGSSQGFFVSTLIIAETSATEVLCISEPSQTTLTQTFRSQFLKPWRETQPKLNTNSTNSTQSTQTQTQTFRSQFLDPWREAQLNSRSRAIQSSHCARVNCAVRWAALEILRWVCAGAGLRWRWAALLRWAALAWLR